MIRTTITPENIDIHLSVPPEYIGRKIEVLLYATDEISEEESPKKTMSSFWGVLSGKTTEDLQKSAAKSRNEWEKNI